MQKARGHPYCYRLPLHVGKWFQILFHSPHRGTFHLSLTVLVHYRSSRVFSLGRWTSLLPTGLACPMVLKVCNESPGVVAYRGFTRSACAFQHDSANTWFCNSLGSLPKTLSRLTTPDLQRRQSITQIRFGLLPFRSPLLRECSLFLEVLRCFSSLRAPR